MFFVVKYSVCMQQCLLWCGQNWTILCFLTERTTIFKKHCVLLHDSFFLWRNIYWKNLYAQTLVQAWRERERERKKKLSSTCFTERCQFKWNFRRCICKYIIHLNGDDEASNNRNWKKRIIKRARFRFETLKSSDRFHRTCIHVGIDNTAIL